MSSSSGNRISRDALGTGLLRVAALALAFGVSVVLARALGPESYGRYSIALSVVTLGALVASLGSRVLVTREVAAYLATNQFGALRGLVVVVAVSTATASVLAAGAVIWIDVAVQFEDAPSSGLLRTALVLIPIVVLTGASTAFVRGLGFVVPSQVPESIARGSSMLAFVFGAAQAGWLTSPTTAMVINVCSAIVALLLAAAMVVRYGGSLLSGPGDRRFEMKRWTLSAVPLIAIAGMQVLYLQLDILMVGGILGAESAGVYRIAERVGIVFGLPTAAVAMSLGPVMARHASTRDRVAFTQAYLTGRRLAVAATVVLVVGGLIGGGRFLEVAFGSEYAEAYWPMLVLGVGWVLAAVAGPNWAAVSMSRLESAALPVILLTALLNILGNTVLVKHYGLVGAAAATATSTFLLAAGLRTVINRSGLLGASS